MRNVHHSFIVKIVFCCFLSLNLFLSAQAQQNVEYRMEIGGALGGSFYMGDANYTRLFNRTGFAGGFIGRYHLNPHMAIKANLLMGKIAGNTADQPNKYPKDLQSEFSRTIYDLGVQFEYNFFGFGAGESYKGNKRLTPYLLAGLGLTHAPKPARSLITMNIPLGIGLKYKLTNRLNAGAEFTMRFSLSDELDVTHEKGLQLNDPYLVKGKGFKNKDSYSFLMLFLTYNISPKYRECNNNY